MIPMAGCNFLKVRRTSGSFILFKGFHIITELLQHEYFKGNNAEWEREKVI